MLALPFVVLNVTAVLRKLDRSLERAGRILGAGPIRTFVRVMLPLTLDDGSASEAWTYVYNWPVTGLPHIASGKFLEQ